MKSRGPGSQEVSKLRTVQVGIPEPCALIVPWAAGHCDFLRYVPPRPPGDTVCWMEVVLSGGSWRGCRGCVLEVVLSGGLGGAAVKGTNEDLSCVTC